MWGRHRIGMHKEGGQNKKRTGKLEVVVEREVLIGKLTS